MKQNFFKILVTIVAVFVIFLILFGGWSVVRSVNTVDEIGAIANELNLQRDLKQECLDNLNYEESRLSALGFTKPCIQFDEKIMELDARLDEFLVKDYMKPVGLPESREAQQ